MISKRLKQCRRGFSLLEVMIVSAIMSTLLAIATPGWMVAREKAQATQCVASLRTIEAVKEQWAIATKAAPGDTPLWSQLVGPGKFLNTQPSCPAGGIYFKGSMSQRPWCSIADNGTPDPKDDHILQ